MNYIYDILVNFKETLYDFYEWNKNDNITHIRKIPLFRINDNFFKDICEFGIKVDRNFLEKIKNRTEEFGLKKVSNIKYACILSNNIDSVCVKFNENGVVTHKSKLIIDENEEVIEVSSTIEETSVSYEVTKKVKNDIFKTRKEISIEKYIYEQLSNTNNSDKLEYLFYDCFNEKENNKEKIIKKIKDKLNNDWDNIAYKVYDFFKLSSIKK